MTLKEHSAAQKHFVDLCRLIGHPTLAEADPTGITLTFEVGVQRQRGGTLASALCLGGARLP
jgi:hypothetical protein